MNFEAQLDKYAELVVRAGLNVQQGQEVLIEADLEAAPLVRLAAKARLGGGREKRYRDVERRGHHAPGI